MNHGQIEDCGSSERVYLRPASQFSAGFMGDLNQLDVVVESVSSSTITLSSALGRHELPTSALPDGDLEVGQTAVLAFRPEHILQCGREDALSLGAAQVANCAFFGTHQKATLETRYGEQSISAHFSQQAAIATGDRVEIYVERDSVMLFAAGNPCGAGRRG